MLSVASNGVSTIEIKKSKFYAYCYFVDIVDGAIDILQTLDAKYPDATHICYAYVIDSPSTERAVDDGEPDGTAGRPILDVLKKRRLSNVMVAVVRYFGGVKLGAGPLARAYSTCATSVLDSVSVAEYSMAYFYKETIHIDSAKAYIRQLQSSGAVITSIEYGDKVSIEYYCFSKLSDNYIECKLCKVGAV